MQALEVTPITKETQKIILKVMCEHPTLGAEELSAFFKTSEKKISQEEVLQVLHSISPNKNWHRATKEEIQKEILEFLWIFEAQVLFLLPTKQKETTIAEFNQIRLQNKQSKIQKDIIRHLQSLLQIENKNLAKFRKFEKELSYQNDIDANTQAMWAVRIVLAGLNLTTVNEVQDFPAILINQFKEQFPILQEKVGKTISRICERFIDKYFPKNISVVQLKELISIYQNIFRTHKGGISPELTSQTETFDQNKTIQKAVEELNSLQDVVSKSEEKNSFFSRFFSSPLRGKEGIITKIDAVIGLLNQINDLNSKTNKTTNEKVLLLQKLQSDYENIVLVKNQLENDLYNLNEKYREAQEKITDSEKELQHKTDSLEKAHEKIAYLQQKVNEIPELESKTNILREELSTAKDISLRLYQRINRIKADLHKLNNDKPKTHKINNGRQTTNGLQPLPTEALKDIPS